VAHHLLVIAHSHAATGQDGTGPARPCITVKVTVIATAKAAILTLTARDSLLLATTYHQRFLAAVNPLVAAALQQVTLREGAGYLAILKGALRRRGILRVAAVPCHQLARHSDAVLLRRVAPDKLLLQVFRSKVGARLWKLRDEVRLLDSNSSNKAEVLPWRCRDEARRLDFNNKTEARPSRIREGALLLASNNRVEARLLKPKAGLLQQASNSNKAEAHQRSTLTPGGAPPILNSDSPRQSLVLGPVAAATLHLHLVSASNSLGGAANQNLSRAVLHGMVRAVASHLSSPSTTILRLPR
jgi:hypothetical protein